MTELLHEMLGYMREQKTPSLERLHKMTFALSIDQLQELDRKLSQLLDDVETLRNVVHIKKRGEELIEDLKPREKKGPGWCVPC